MVLNNDNNIGKITMFVVKVIIIINSGGDDDGDGGGGGDIIKWKLLCWDDDGIF